MPTILVPDSGPITINDGGSSKVYRPKDGELVVDEAHVIAILGAVAGSKLKPEPEPKTKPETPAKEK